MNLLKKITNNSKDKFNLIQKKINIKKQYSIDFEIINKETKIVFKDKGVTMTKLGRDLNKYAETNKFENIKSKAKKVEGKTCICWIGIRSVLLIE